MYLLWIEVVRTYNKRFNVDTSIVYFIIKKGEYFENRWVVMKYHLAVFYLKQMLLCNF